MAEPYYSDDLVTLYHGDCREITEWLTADVLVTDPPYGIGYSGFTGKHDIHGDESTALRDAALRLWGGDRPALVFGTWQVPKPAATRMQLIWAKGNVVSMGSLTLPWGSSHEEIYVLGPWPPLKPGGRLREGGTPARSASVLTVPTFNSQDRNRPDHPTPKPTGLMETLIERCPPGSVADPFAGSGSTLVAAKLQGRHAIGVEVEERYCAIAAERLSQDALPFEVA